MIAKKPVYDTAIVQLEQKYLEEPHDSGDGYAEVLNEAARTVIQLKKSLNAPVPPPERHSEVRVGAQSWQEYIFYNRTGSGIDILDWQPTSPRFPPDVTDRCGSPHPHGAGAAASSGSGASRCLASSASSRRTTVTPTSSRRYRAVLSSRALGSRASLAAGGVGARSRASSPSRGASVGGGLPEARNGGNVGAGSTEGSPGSPAAAAVPRAPAAAPSGRPPSTPLRQSRGRHLHGDEHHSQHQHHQQQPHARFEQASDGGAADAAAQAAQPRTCLNAQSRSQSRADGTRTGTGMGMGMGGDGGSGARAGPVSPPEHVRWSMDGREPEACGRPAGLLAVESSLVGCPPQSGSIGDGGGSGSALHPHPHCVFPDPASCPCSEPSTSRNTGTGSDPREELAAAEAAEAAAAAAAEGAAAVCFRGLSATGSGDEASPRRRRNLAARPAASCRDSDSGSGNGDGSGAEEAAEAHSDSPRRRESLADEAIRAFARTAYEPGEVRQSLLLMHARNGTDASCASPRPLMHAPPYAYRHGHGHGRGHGHGPHAQQQGLAPVPSAVPRHVAEALSAMSPCGRCYAATAPLLPQQQQQQQQQHLAAVPAAASPLHGAAAPGEHAAEAGLPWLGLASPAAPRGRFPSQAGSPAPMRPRRPSCTEGLRHSWQPGATPRPAAATAAAAAAAAAGSLLDPEDRPLLALARHYHTPTPAAAAVSVGAAAGGVAGAGEGSRTVALPQAGRCGGARGVAVWQGARQSYTGGIGEAGATGSPPLAPPHGAAAASAPHRASDAGGGGSGGGAGGLIRGYAGGGLLDHHMLDLVPRLALDAPRIRPQVAVASSPARASYSGGGRGCHDKGAAGGGGSGGGAGGGHSLHADAAALAAASPVDCQAELRRGLLAAPAGLAGLLQGSRPSTAWSDVGGGSGGGAGPAAGVGGASPGRFVRARRASVPVTSSSSSLPPPSPAGAAAPATTGGGGGGRGCRGGMLVTREQVDGHSHPQHPQRPQQRGSGPHGGGVLGMRGCLTEAASGGGSPVRAPR